MNNEQILRKEYYNFYLELFKSIPAPPLRWSSDNKLISPDFSWINEIEILIKECYVEHAEEIELFLTSKTSFYILADTLRQFGATTQNELLSNIATLFIEPEEKINSIYDPFMREGGNLLTVYTNLKDKSIEIAGKSQLQDAYFFTGLRFILRDLSIKGLGYESELITKRKPVDLIISFPPFGDRIDKSEGFLDNKSEGVYIEHALNTLKENGKAILLVPISWLGRKGKLKQQLLQKNRIDGVIQLPFFNEELPYNLAILILRKDRKEKDFFMANLSDFVAYPREEGFLKFVESLKTITDNYKLGIIDTPLARRIDYTEIAKSLNDTLVPSFYLFKEKEKLDTFLTSSDTIALKDVLYNIHQYTKLPKEPTDDYVPARVILSKNWKTVKGDLFYDLSFVKKEQALVSSYKLLKNNSILLKNADIQTACIFQRAANDELDYGLGKGVLNLEIDTSKILPQYLVYQLKSEFTRFQLERRQLGKSNLKRYSIGQLRQLKIKVPHIGGQLMFLNSQNDVYQTEEENHLLVAEEPLMYNKYIPQISLDKVIQHYLLNHIRPIDNYMVLLKDFIDKLPGNTNGDLWEKGINEASEVTLRKVYHKITHFHADLENIVTNFEDLNNLQKDLAFERRSLKKMLSDLTEKYNEDIEISITGDNVIIPINEFAFSIIMENLLSNAIKHGFIGEFAENKKIEFEIIRHQQTKVVDILYKNNGQPFPYTFNFNDFLSADKRAGGNAGMGLGGNLIELAIRKHEGTFESISIHGRNLSGWNVTFKISLDLNKLL